MRRRVAVGVLAVMLVLGPTAVADTIEDDPDNRVSSTLGRAGAYPCSRADMTEATYERPEQGRDAVLLQVRSLVGACPSDEVVQDSVDYQLTYIADEPLYGQDVYHKMSVDTTWENGELVRTWVHEYYEWDEGWVWASYGDASEIVDVANDTVEIPAPGEPPLDDVVLRTYDSVQVDRMPNRGNASFGS